MTKSAHNLQLAESVCISFCLWISPFQKQLSPLHELPPHSRLGGFMNVRAMLSGTFNLVGSPNAYWSWLRGQTKHNSRRLLRWIQRICTPCTDGYRGGNTSGQLPMKATVVPVSKCCFCHLEPQICISQSCQGAAIFSGKSPHIFMRKYAEISMDDGPRFAVVKNNLTWACHYI